MKKDDHIYKRPNGTWQVRITMGTKPDGSPNRVSKTFKTRVEARAYRDSMTSALGADVSLLKITVRDWVQRYIDVYGHSLQPDTLSSYKYIYKSRIFGSSISGIYLSDLRPSHIQAWVNEMKKRNGEPLHPSTVRAYLKFFSSCMNRAVDEKIIRESPVRRISLPGGGDKTRKIMDEETAQKILDISYKKRDYNLYVVAITTGMRRSELLGLCWDCIDLESGECTVRRKVTRAGKKVYDSTKTEGSRRSFYLPRVAIDAMKNQKRKNAERRMAAGCLWIENNLVFPDEFGMPQNPATVSARFDSMQRKAGMVPVGLHAFRHYFATHMILHGVDVATVSSILGHSKPSFTMDQYQDLYKDGIRSAADVAGNIVSNGANGTDWRGN